MEPVHFYGEFDGENDLPMSGVASFHGSPHYFSLVGYCFEVPRTAEYELSPVTEAVIPYVLELAAIWHRWELAYHAGEVPIESWPALPPDRETREQALSIIKADQVAAQDSLFIRAGTFRTSATYAQKMSSLAGKRWPVPGFYSAELEVKWSDENDA